MIIATWNVERLQHKANLNDIVRKCEDLQADILVLTETDSRICPDYRYCFKTPFPGSSGTYYKPTENHVSVFTNYGFVREYSTYDPYTAICVELETEHGNLMVYGTIMGIYGNRDPSFIEDLREQTADFRRLSEKGKSLCIAGDFNCTFSESYYFTKAGRKLLTDSFLQNDISVLTADRKECIDHIAVSSSFLTDNAQIKIFEWNLDKRLSDHKGIMVDIST